MEPRGSVGVYDKAADRYTIYTTLQRALDFREKLAETLRVPKANCASSPAISAAASA